MPPRRFKNPFDTTDSDSDLDPIKTIIPALFPLVADQGRRFAPAPLHDSKLTGAEKIQEWRERHPAAMRNQLGVSPLSFDFILSELETHANFRDTRYVSSAEQLSHFLYICRKAMSIRHTAEALQRSYNTVSESFHSVLAAITSEHFYQRCVVFPTSQTPPSPIIMEDGRFNHWLENCIGAMDGTHIPAHPPIDKAKTYRNRKGYLSINVLACCTFDMRFTYILSGWEGSANDGKVYQEAVNDDLVIPPDRFLLADAGYGSCRSMLVPFRGVRYHLKEWAKGNQRPRDYKELYNLRHASAKNVVERIFGVAKAQWAILARGCHYDLLTQGRVIYAIAVLHNMLHQFEHTPNEPIPSLQQIRARYGHLDDDSSDDDDDDGVAAVRAPLSADHEKKQGEKWREQVAQEVWCKYEDYNRSKKRKRA